MKLKPKHSFESVVDELIEGLESGTIAIRRSVQWSSRTEGSSLANSISEKLQAPTSLEHQQARGFAQTLGLHPAMALLTLIINAMIFGSAGVAGLTALPTGGTSLVALTAVSTICGVILGIITYLAQKKWYGDDKESAVIKALIVAFLTAIPVGLPAILTIPSGIIGFFRRKN